MYKCEKKKEKKKKSTITVEELSSVCRDASTAQFYYNCHVRTDSGHSVWLRVILCAILSPVCNRIIPFDVQ